MNFSWTVICRSAAPLLLPFVRFAGESGVASRGLEHRTMSDDLDYFTRRAMEEEEAAKAAASLTARWRHEELASLYWSLANGARPDNLSIIADAIIRPGDIAL
jgi:hypothetical protein